MDETSDFVIITAAAKTASGNSSDIISDRTGLMLFLNITGFSGTTPTLDVKVQGKDPASGTYVDMPGASFAQKVGTGSDTLLIYPGVTSTVNRQISAALPNVIRIAYTIGGTTPSFTFSIGASALS
jgi:hypothetical protein